MPKRLLLIAVASFLGGCQTTPLTGKLWTPAKFKPDIVCPARIECSAWVNPLNDWVPKRIEVDPERDDKGARKRRAVTWYSAWVFENGGVQFTGENAKFISCQQHGPWKVACTIDAKAPEKTEFKYNVDVLGYDPVDPWVFNR